MFKDKTLVNVGNPFLGIPLYIMPPSVRNTIVRRTLRPQLHCSSRNHSTNEIRLLFPHECRRQKPQGANYRVFLYSIWDRTRTFLCLTRGHWYISRQNTYTVVIVFFGDFPSLFPVVTTTCIYIYLPTLL